MPSPSPERKVRLSKDASQKWGALSCIPRSIMVAAQSTMHSRVPKEYPLFRKLRVKGREDFACRYQFVILDPDAACSHVFTLDFDDATSPDHLFLLDVTHARFDAD